MESSINRWRAMGTTNDFINPNEQKPVFKLAQKEKKPQSNRKGQVEYRVQPKLRHEKIGIYLGKMESEQKKDIIQRAGRNGYLNQNHMNQSLKLIQPKTSHFGDQGDSKDIFDILESFDAVKGSGDSIKPAKKTVDYTPQGTTRLHAPKFLPKSKMFLTKLDLYRNMTNIDTDFIRSGRKLRHSHKGKQDHLKKYYRYIAEELEANQCPERGPDLKRLSIYSNCFEQLIQEFTSFAPILADIKKEYDRIISSYESNEQEFIFLRTKVQKLLAQNENRMLLKFETQKSQDLNKQIDQLKAENEKLKSEMRYKLSTYASYIPEAILNQHKIHDDFLANIDTSPFFSLEGDPLKAKDEIIDEQDRLIKEKIKEIQSLMSNRDADFVPKVTKDKIEETIKHLNDKYQNYLEKNRIMESDFVLKKESIRQMESQLKLKEQQYQFLVIEYNQIAENLKPEKPVLLNELKALSIKEDRTVDDNE
ncbi:hypothetical protein BC833DRAFT_649583 [Globomyces pollinis-pini]|nr:hypothetical protein BC833DRAFT_649583 [Globomyces pollinis-pini]